MHVFRAPTFDTFAYATELGILYDLKFIGLRFKMRVNNLEHKICDNFGKKKNDTCFLSKNTMVSNGIVRRGIFLKFNDDDDDDLGRIVVVAMTGLVTPNVVMEINRLYVILYISVFRDW